MKLLISGDPHLKISNIDTSGQYLSWMYSLQVEYKPDQVIILGDLFDTHSIMRVEILNLWYDYLKQSPIPHILIKGNHDETAPGSNIHALTGLKSVATVIDQPTNIGNLSFIQYVHTEADFREAIRDLKGKYLFCHQTFDGAQYENGFYAPEAFDLSMLDKFKYTISGHIHKRQLLSQASKPILYYPGTPYAANFADANELKGVISIDLETELVTTIPSPCPAYYVNYFDSPEEVLNSFSTKDQSQDKFKIILRDSRASIRAFIDSQEFKKLKKLHNITFSPEYTDIIKRKIKFDENASAENILDKYIQNVLETKLDKKRLHELAKNILDTV